MASCTCDIGYSVCGSNCPNTKMRCQCRNNAGDMVVGDVFDFGQLLSCYHGEMVGYSGLIQTQVTTSTLLGPRST